MLELRDVYKIYGMGDIAVHALDGVSCQFESGELIAITGPSGSGKSTLMNVMGCLDTPTSGQYKLEGNDVAKLSEDQLAIVRNRIIGFVFQSFNLLPRKTALDNVALPLLYRGASRAEREERAFESLKSVGLGDRTHHKPIELSGGQSQRVAVARALVSKPKIVLADEPTGNLDTKSSNEIMDLLVGLSESEDLAVAIVTHDPTVAKRCRRQIVIVDGKIAEDKTGEAS